MIPTGKKVRSLYAKMNHRFQLSFEAYVKKLLELNPRRKKLILREAESAKGQHRKDLEALCETGWAEHSPGLYLAESQRIDNLMKKSLKHSLESLNEISQKTKLIIFQTRRKKK